MDHYPMNIISLSSHMDEIKTVIPEIPFDLGTNLTLETSPVRIVDRMEKAMRRKTIKMVKVFWDCNGQEQVTWETEARMKADFRE
ncbi:hypothetical protein N665_0797s0001 [Sinapis alba]|nr:hypothetical protein N665_0797s0001 [Sinapis alba]